MTNILNSTIDFINIVSSLIKCGSVRKAIFKVSARLSLSWDWVGGWGLGWAKKPSSSSQYTSMIIVKFSTGKNIGSIFLHTKCTTCPLKCAFFPPKCSAQRLVKRIKGNSAILGNIKISPFLLCTNLAISCLVFPPPVQSILRDVIWIKTRPKSVRWCASVTWLILLIWLF